MLYFIILLWAFLCHARSINNRPIIGILSQPVDEPSLQIYGTSYIAASYVKYVEAGGAQVVPLIYDEDPSNFTLKLAAVNGVLLPGGGTQIDQDPYASVLKQIFGEVLRSFDQRNQTFPLWGTCQGFEELAYLVAGNISVLTQFDAENISLPLTFEKGSENSVLYKNMGAPALQVLKTQAVTMNNHEYGVSPASFKSFGLDKFFTPLTTNYDRKNLQFISSMEGIRYPIFGTQFHPEKPAFEWNPAEGIVHTADSVFANWYFSRFLVNAARNNDRAFASYADEQKYIIYNYSPVFTEVEEPSFEQMYFFNGY